MEKNFNFDSGTSVHIEEMYEAIATDRDFGDWENEEHWKWETLCWRIFKEVDDDTKISIAIKMLNALAKVDIEDNGTVKGLIKLLNKNLSEFAY